MRANSSELASTVGTPSSDTRAAAAPRAVGMVVVLAAGMLCWAAVAEGQARRPSSTYLSPVPLPVFAPPGAITSPPNDYGTDEPAQPINIRGVAEGSERPAASLIEFPLHGPCRWLPAEAPRNQGPGNANRTAAEFEGQRRAYEQLRAVLAAVPIAKPPIGWCPRIATSELFSTTDLGHALRTRLYLQLWPATDLFRRNGQLVLDGEVPGWFIAVNRPLVDGWGPNQFEQMQDSLGRFFPEVPVIGRFQGFPVYLGNRLVISRRDVPLQRPVRVDRILRWFINTRSARLADPWVQSARGEKERTELMAQRASAVAQLAALSGDAAAAPACLSYPASQIIAFDRIVAVGDRECLTPLAERNPDLYDRALPRSAPQVLVIEPNFAFADGAPAGPRPTQREITRWASRHVVWGIDWRAVRRDYLGAP
jgi:hypothetical protein